MPAIRLDLSTARLRSLSDTELEPTAAMLWKLCRCECEGTLMGDHGIQAADDCFETALLMAFREQPPAIQAHWLAVAQSCTATFLELMGATPLPTPPAV